MKPIIVDTSGLYALIDRHDVNHAQAAAFLAKHGPAGVMLMSNHVFDETMTLVKMRLGMDVAVQFGLRLRNSSLVETVIFAAAEEQRAWRIFVRYRDKAWSYTDCACLALAQMHETTFAFTFDHHFAQMGLFAPPADLS